MTSFHSRETSTTGGASASSLLHTYATPLLADEMVMAVIYGTGNPHAPGDTPAGVWNTPTDFITDPTYDNGLGSSDWSHKGYYLIATGAETDFTFSYSSGSRPIIIVVHRFRLDPGEAWGTFESPADTSHHNADSGSNQVFIFEHAGPLAERIIMGAGLVTTRDTNDTIDAGANSYIPPVGYTDVFPGDGSNDVLSYAITSGALDTNKETAIWDGYRLNVTTEPDEDMTWTTGGVGGESEVFLSRWAMTIEAAPVVEAHDTLSTVATLDHDLIFGQEPDQHHPQIHDLDGPHTGFTYKRGVSPVITDSDMTQTPANGMMAVTYDTSTGITLLWQRVSGEWTAVEASV